MAGSAGWARLFRPAQRHRRCHVRHHGGLRVTRRPLHGAHRARQEVVNMATQNKVEEKVDVVIAGAGASGSTFAAVLAKAGKKVVLIDNGPARQPTGLFTPTMWGRPS